MDMAHQKGIAETVAAGVECDETGHKERDKKALHVQRCNPDPNACEPMVRAIEHIGGAQQSRALQTEGTASRQLFDGELFEREGDGIQEGILLGGARDIF